MPDREKVIRLIEEEISVCESVNQCYRTIDLPALRDILALLKAQEPETMDAPKPDSDIGCWYDITHNYTLEQVVSALKEQEPPTSEFISSAIECLLHPQDADDSDMAKAIDTAVRAMRLLKAQEPRVMTLDELSEKTDVYFESLVYDTICPALSAGSYDDGTVGLMTLEDELFYMDEADYGVQWRCWTSRPTDEQREATPW